MTALAKSRVSCQLYTSADNWLLGSNFPTVMIKQKQKQKQTQKKTKQKTKKKLQTQTNKPTHQPRDSFYRHSPTASPPLPLSLSFLFFLPQQRYWACFHAYGTPILAVVQSFAGP